MFSKKLIVTAVFLFQVIYIIADNDGFNIETTREPMKKALRSSYINDKQYVMGTMLKVSWFRAAHICKYNGMELASINNVEEQNLIGKLIDSSGFGLETNRFWTSGNDLGRQYNWYWLSTGKPLPYINWSYGEPNNYNNMNERCIYLNPRVVNYSWCDCYCDLEIYFVCEEAKPGKIL